MSTFNLNDPPPLCSFSDIYGSEPKPRRLPVHLQIHKLLKEHVGAATSTGGQTFAYVPNRFNSFTVPLRSNFLRNWLTERHTATGNPPPTAPQLRAAITAFESRPAAG